MNETGSSAPLLPPPESPPLPPETPETVPAPETPPSPEAFPLRAAALIRDSALPWLRRAVPAALMGFALLLSAAAAVLCLSAAGITGDGVARFLLADAAGGAGALRRTESALALPLPPEGRDALQAPSPVPPPPDTGPEER